MSLYNEDRLVEMGHGSPKEPKISYSREFLLSLSELVECQKLPDGFDQSLLSEFEDAPQERFRPSDSLSSQSFRRNNEYGSSPPNRGDGNSFTRGNRGRWDSRSSGGRTDRDTDSQPDKEPDPGRRYANQSRRPWQVPEHDGLLGSGSFPRPTGYAAGTGVTKSQSGDQFPLNRSNEPYHPPKPYKAIPHTRRETNDSFNDETFGSSEYTNEDRAEEEMKRRASFELMRKEQHEAFQEKQKNPEKRIDNFDITFKVDGRKDDSGVLKLNNEISSSDSNKSNVATMVPTSRPLVPPGFSSTSGEKNFGTKSSPHPLPSEVGDELEGNLLHAKVSRTLIRPSRHPEEKQVSEELHLVKQQLGNPSIHELLETKNWKNQNFPSALGDSDETAGFTGEFPRNFEASVNIKLVEPGAKDVRMNKVVTGSSPAQSSSILEKLFSSASTLNAGFDVKETPNVEAMKVDDSSKPRMKQSSKFSQWFLEKDKKPVDDLPVDRPSDLLSLMVGSDRGSFSTVGDDTSKPITALQSSKAIDVCRKENFKAPNHQDTERLQMAGKPQRVSAVLTCEDLEQSILSEVNVNRSTPLIQIWSGPEAKSEQQKATMDNHASQHLLSLLQKGTGPQDVAFSHMLGIDASAKPEVKISKDADAGDSSSTEKLLTLETLFGTAFMKELKPAGTPPADNRGSVGAGRVDNADSSFPILGDGPLPPATENELRLSGYGNSITAPNQRQQVEPVQGHFFGFGLRSEPDSSLVQAEFGSKPRVFDRSEVGLPQEDGLISVGDPMNLHDFMQVRNLSKSELLLSRDAPPDISGKLAPLNSVFREELPLRGSQEPFPRSHDARETEWSSLHAQSSSPHVHQSLLNNSGRSSLMESHRSHPSNFNSQMKYMPSEKIFDHDNSRHQFLTNMIQPPLNHPDTGPGGFDLTTHGPMFQQLQVSGAFPPPHLSPGFPRGVPLPSHPSNLGFRQEASAMQGIPFGQRQPNLNLGGLGIGPRAPEVWGGAANHPEALQRLFEMELRSNAKQPHPLAASVHGQGVHGHELDPGFGFR